NLLIDLPQQVDLLRVHLDRLVLAPVAHDPVDLLQSLFVVLAVLLVGNGEVFVGVDVMQNEGAGIAVGARMGQPDRTGHEKTSGEACAAHRARKAQTESGNLRGATLHCAVSSSCGRRPRTSPNRTAGTACG